MKVSKNRKPVFNNRKPVCQKTGFNIPRYDWPYDSTAAPSNTMWPPLTWFESYLSYHSQIVVLDDSRMTWTLVEWWDRGSVLGPILYLLYTADSICQAHDKLYAELLSSKHLHTVLWLYSSLLSVQFPLCHLISPLERRPTDKIRLTPDLEQDSSSSNFTFHFWRQCFLTSLTHWVSATWVWPLFS